MEGTLEVKEHALPSSPPPRVEEPDPRQSLQHVLAAADSPAQTTTYNDDMFSSNHSPPTRRLQSVRKRSAGLVRPAVQKLGKEPDSPTQSATQNDDMFSSNHSTPAKKPTVWVQEPGQEPLKEHTDEESNIQNDSHTRSLDVNPSYTMTVAHTRKNANGTIGSVYSGNKIRHLKKDDGIPLWRKDIQFAFLRAVFEDTTPVFTKASDGSPHHSFADIYIDAMARSSKTSKILRDKLLSDRGAALNMAMVCLLVNVGRMNTTLNFFPEMRAQLRTYHSIPSLQASQDPNAYKQLQDAPRLKSILKGACEDPEQPNTVEKIQLAPIPRTNPVNLIFVLSQYAPKISERHFHPPRDFFDLVMRSTLSSQSRAKGFLWLIWWYLESDFSKSAAEANPFGPGQYGEGSGGMPVKVPAFEHLNEEQANAENVDTEIEKAFGEMKKQERKRILEEDETVGPLPKTNPPPVKRARKGLNTALDEGLTEHLFRHVPISDTDRTRSPSPIDASQSHAAPKWGRYSNHASSSTRLQGSMLSRRSSGNDIFHPEPKHRNRLIMKNKPDETPDSSSPVAGGAGHSITQANASSGTSQRRSRPETSHQKAVSINRRMHVDHILHNDLNAEHKRVHQKKKRLNHFAFFTSLRRIIDLPEDYDTEDENSWGPGGLVPNLDEEEDFGEEALRHQKVLNRAIRRLGREDSNWPLHDLSKGYQMRKRRMEDRDGYNAQGESPLRKRNKNGVGPRMMAGNARSAGVPNEALDDLDLDLLGESREDNRGEEQVEENSAVDESEGGEEDTEDEAMDEE